MLNETRQSCVGNPPPLLSSLNPSPPSPCLYPFSLSASNLPSLAWCPKTSINHSPLFLSTLPILPVHILPAAAAAAASQTDRKAQSRSSMQWKESTTYYLLERPPPSSIHPSIPSIHRSVPRMELLDIRRYHILFCNFATGMYRQFWHFVFFFSFLAKAAPSINLVLVPCAELSRGGLDDLLPARERESVGLLG